MKINMTNTPKLKEIERNKAKKPQNCAQFVPWNCPYWLNLKSGDLGPENLMPYVRIKYNLMTNKFNVDIIKGDCVNYER